MKKMTFTSRLLSILLCVCMVLSLLPAVAFAADMTGGEVLYLKPNSNWTSADARFAVYFYGDGNAWESMVPVDGADGLYEVTVPGGRWTNVIFCRMNPSTETNSWDNKWNQTGDLVYDGINNLCTIHDGQWDCGNNVTWSSYSENDEPACTHDSHSQDGKCNACGETVEHTYVDGSCACGAVDPAEPVSITTYCINSAKWDDVYAYVWGEGGNGAPWPGTAMTKTGETVNGFDIYEVTFDAAYENVIFNNRSGSQTGDLAFQEGQYYDVKNSTWYESLDDVPVIDLLVTDRYLVGSFNGWSTTANEFKLDVEGSTTGYVSLELEANTTYEFKIVREGAWTSCATPITGDASDLTFSSSIAGNCTITTTVAGTYVFAFGTNTSALSVTYPNGDEPACPHDSHGQDGKCTACGETVEHTYVDGSCVCGAVIEYMSIYFQNNWMWTDVKLHYWGSASGNTEWPGTAMTLDGNDGNYDIYVFEVPTDIEGITISGTKDDGSGALDKTPDITGGWYDGICYYMTWNDGNQANSEPIDVILPRTYTVNVGGTVTDYTDFGTAINAACAAESAVLTLYQNAPAGTHHFSQGNVTLDLNGMTCEGRITVFGATLTLTDSAQKKGTVVNYAGYAVTFYEGKLLLLETVDLLGSSDGHSPMCLGKGAGVGTVTVGSSGKEDIVLPASIVAIGLVSREETSVLLEPGQNVALHRHNWIEATCTTSAFCTDCATVGPEAPGHSIGEDGVCTVCGIDPTKAIYINMTDSYGDGWNGNALEIYENGVLLTTATFDDGAESTVTVPFNPEKGYTFVWVKGEYSEECGFEIVQYGQTLFSCDDCSAFSNEETVYTLCDHSYGQGVETEASCTEKGGIYYTCTKCGDTYVENEVPALGHSFGDDDICDICGAEKTLSVTVNMIDTYGDGWNGNTIVIGSGEELVDMVTLEDGAEGSWTGELDPDGDYDFYWFSVDYPDECAFQVLINGEVIFETDACDGYRDGDLLFSIIDGEIVIPEVVNSVYVGGVELLEGNYLDLDGNVSAEEPDGGYAYYDGTTLTLNDYTYTGKGYVIEAFEMDGETIEATAIVYTALDELSIQLEGANTLTGTGMINYGVIVGMADPMDIELGTLVLSGTGTLNLTGYAGIGADYITLNSGIVNISAFQGIQTPNGDSSLTVNGGELTVTAFDGEDSAGIYIGDVVINGGKLLVSCDSNLALNVVTLTVNGGYLEVVGDMEAYHPDIDEPITLGEGVSITSPEGAAFGTFYNNNGLLIHTICDADGNIADAFVIEGPDVEQGGDQEPFDVVVYNVYGTADTVTLSNSVAIPGQDYVTTVSSTVGSGIGVWSVYVAEEDLWYGNYIYEFDEETNTLTVFGDHVAAGMQIEVVPYVTLTTHMNGGSAMNDYWEHVFGPDETGTFTEEWAYGKEGYFFGTWDESGAMVPDPNQVFKREGYTVVGYNTAADGSGTAYAVDALHKLTEDVEIYLIWQSNEAECPHAWIDATCTTPKTCELCGETEGEALGHSEPVYTNNGVNHSAVYPCCSETVVRNEAHTYVDGLCVCGSNSNLRNGIYAEDGSLFYYRNGNRYYAGLIEIDGDFYYVRSNGELVHGRTYWPTKTNGLKDAANYYFDETGKISAKNGLVAENGGLYYYVDGKLNYAGLIEIDGAFYYIRSNGQAVTDQSYWITKTNDLKPAASYTFGADGKMVVQGSFVQEADGIYYYVDGKRNYAGLILVDGNYYYVRSNGQLVTGRSYWITKTNDRLPAANYTFDANGVMENPPA